MAGRDMLCPVCHAPVRVPAAGPREGELEPAADAGAESATSEPRARASAAADVASLRNMGLLGVAGAANP